MPILPLMLPDPSPLPRCRPPALHRPASIAFRARIRRPEMRKGERHFIAYANPQPSSLDAFQPALPGLLIPSIPVTSLPPGRAHVREVTGGGNLKVHTHHMDGVATSNCTLRT